MVCYADKQAPAPILGLVGSSAARDDVGAGMTDDRSDHARVLAEELLTDVELSRTTVAQQVMKAVRLSRLVADHGAATWLGYEMNGIPNNEAGRRHMTRTRRWTDREEGKGWWGPAADIEASISALNEQLANSRIDSLSGDSIYPTARDHRLYQAGISNRVQEYAHIINRVRGMVHEFAVRTYYELVFSEEQRRLFDSAREEIDSLLAPTSAEALEKVDAIYRRLSEGDVEAVSQAMNTCRRLIDAFADSVYPARDQLIEIAGTPVQVGRQHTQNRINAFVAEKTESKSRRNRVRRALSDIYERVSVSVHGDVSANEARYLFLATYVLLGEILSLGAAGSE